MKIVDCFSYFNEKEILEFRIKLLYDYVDKFIITESDHTHSGHPKKFTCLKTLQELNISLDKIELIHVKLPNYEENSCNWVRERAQRNVATNLFEDDAVYIVSDCDEIINPEMIPYYVDGMLNNQNNILRIPMAFLNCRPDLRIVCPKGIPMSFNDPFMCMKKHTKKYTLSEIREAYATRLENLEYPSLYLLDSNQQPVESGWHFSWMGGKDRMKIKMQSFLHSYDKKEGIFTTAISDINSLEMKNYLDSYEAKEGSRDPYGRTDYLLAKYPIEKLPKKLFELTHIKKFMFGETL
jgi:beta-1,4-mannosyl-glycoprotein beta-1,4-N-acetylglucosaminyltransferase